MMLHRSTNRAVLFIMLMCSFSITGATWVISEKFIAHGTIALIFNIGISALIAYLFGKIIESKLNRSIDFLMHKLDRIANGDLTQRFLEDQMDMLPYGLSFKMGQMMDFFREKIGLFWRVTVNLIHQLDAFQAVSKENWRAIKEEVDGLNLCMENLGDLRNHVMELNKKITDGKIIIHQHLLFLQQAGQTAFDSQKQTGNNLYRPKNMRERISNARLLVSTTHTLLKDYQGIGRQLSGIQSALAGLASEAKLVRLNSNIDLSQNKEGGNTTQIITETQRILSKVNDLAQESGNLSTTLQHSTSQILSDLEKENDQLEKTARDMEYIESMIQALNSKNSATHARFITVQNEMAAMNDFIQMLEQQFVLFVNNVKEVSSQIDRLKTNAMQNKLNVDRMNRRVSAIQEILQQLDTFKNQFHIA